MSEISINTLKTMLANLDDAKKYQSLRDVMETLPAPDLAAVFEDLPSEKLPVLFRLCPKDLAADVFTDNIGRVGNTNHNAFKINLF